MDQIWEILHTKKKLFLFTKVYIFSSIFANFVNFYLNMKFYTKFLDLLKLSVQKILT